MSQVNQSVSNEQQNNSDEVLVYKYTIIKASDKIKNLVKNLTDDEILEFFTFKRVHDIFEEHEIYA